MDNLDLLIDLHKHEKRQGPGDGKETEKALALAALDRSRPLKVADIGCGTGASTLVLAKQLNAQITAVDFLPEFIDILQANAKREGLDNRIDPLVCAMEDLPFSEKEYDLIWSEGAIYNMGFERGVQEWRRFLKPGGKLVVSEITWSTNDRPRELQEFWANEYPEIDTASAKMKVLERNGCQIVPTESSASYH